MKPKRKTEKKAAPQPSWKLRMVRRIRKVAEQMRQLGNHMDYYGGFGELGEHGREMQRAAGTALGWAAGLESEAPNYKWPEVTTGSVAARKVRKEMNAKRSKVEYRILEEGEIIKAGDEFLDDATWVLTRNPGLKVLSPCYTSNLLYRRPMTYGKGKP